MKNGMNNIIILTNEPHKAFQIDYMLSELMPGSVR